MSQAYRGPMLLTVAGLLLVFAVAAYLIGDLQSNARRHESVLLEQELLRDSRAWSIEVHAELEHQRAAITETRRRLDDLTRRLATVHADLEKLKNSRIRSAPLDPSATTSSSMASDN